MRPSTVGPQSYSPYTLRSEDLGRGIFFMASTAAPESHEEKDRKSTRLNSSHDQISYAVFCLKKKNVMYALRIIERSTARELYGNPRHPYTLCLLRSVPRLDEPRRARLDPI